MAMKYILYNPCAGGGESEEEIRQLKESYEDSVLINVCCIKSYQTFFDGLEENDTVILCGGDGTLNHFANETKELKIKNEIRFFSTGTGNDFARDLGYEKHKLTDTDIKPYLEHLPTVTVNGKESLFINNVGFGIDGYCCETGDKLREQNEKSKNPKPINYTNIAIKGLLFHFKPCNATVTVDGRQYTYKKVWLAPAMNGRYYGGGMMAAPSQNRCNAQHKVSLMVFHHVGKLGALMIFPSIFKGEHINHKKNITILEGNDITVTFDRPTPLQIDGETMKDVTSYHVHAGV